MALLTVCGGAQPGDLLPPPQPRPYITGVTDTGVILAGRGPGPLRGGPVLPRGLPRSPFRPPGDGRPNPKRHVHAGRSRELAMLMGLPHLGQNKSANPGPADQAPRLVIEWTADLSRPASSPTPARLAPAGRAQQWPVVWAGQPSPPTRRRHLGPASAPWRPGHPPPPARSRSPLSPSDPAPLATTRQKAGRRPTARPETARPLPGSLCWLPSWSDLAAR